MHQPSFRGLMPALWRKFPRPGLATAIFGAGLLVAFATSSFVFAHDNHPNQQPAALNADESAFLKENDTAMTKMMNDMAAKPTGDIDRDFVEMMVPHHQGAVDMAKAELRYGHNEQLRRLAQEIIVTQQQEISVMRLALGDKLPPSAPSPTQPGAMPAPQSGAQDGANGQHAASPMKSQDAMSHDSMNMNINMK